MYWVLVNLIERDQTHTRYIWHPLYLTQYQAGVKYSRIEMIAVKTQRTVVFWLAYGPIGANIVYIIPRAMMTSSNGNIFRVTDQWIPLTKASDAELWYFFLSEPE